VNRVDPLLANRIPSWIGRKLINSALRIEQVDFGGVKAYSAAMVQRLVAMNPPIVVIPAMAYSITRRFVEIPVEHQPRTLGTSKWSILRRMETYLDIYTLFATRPFAWMQIVGFASFLLSLLLGMCIVAYRFLVTDQFSGLIIFFAVFLFATGAYFVSLSIVGEFVVRGLRGNRVDPGQLVDEVVRNQPSENRASGAGGG
jgi:hypothetical protein